MDEIEQLRLAALRGYGVLDTPVEARFDRITELAADLFSAPIALVSLVDDERQWFKSHFGLSTRETPRSWAFCDHAIAAKSKRVFVVPDACADPRFADNPLVTGPPGIRFYAGSLLTTAQGERLGTLCVIDTKPRAWSACDERRLSKLAQLCMDELELSKATQAAEARLRLLGMAESMSGVGHWRFEIAASKVIWSDEVYRIHGVNRQTFDPNLDGAIGFYHPDDQAQVSALLARCQSHREGYDFQLRLTRADGALRHVACKAACELDARGEVAAVVGVFQDITDQVLHVSRVQRSEARYRLLADNMSDVITRIKLDGSKGYISPAIEPLLGYRVEEMHDRPPTAFIHPDDRPGVEAAMARMAAGTRAMTLTYRAVHKAGHPIWVEARLSRVAGLEGQTPEIVVVIRDIRERKAVEAELDSARAAAEAANAVKSEFLSNMSHELRTPLTSILGFSALLAKQGGLSGPAGRYVERIAGSSQALLTIVNDILDFSKLEDGQVEIDPRPCDPKAMVRETLDLLEPQAVAKGLSLSCSFPAGSPTRVMIDDRRVRQVLLNLIGNAVKFTATGQVRVQVEHQAGRLRCEVIDSGPGINPEGLER